MKYTLLGLTIGLAMFGSVALACDSDPSATNYNAGIPDAVAACIPAVLGCTNPAAMNFQNSANVDNGSCIARTYGANPLKANQPLWASILGVAGLDGYGVEANFKTLFGGESITYDILGPGYVAQKNFVDVCPSWYPSIPGRPVCWTQELK